MPCFSTREFDLASHGILHRLFDIRGDEVPSLGFGISPLGAERLAQTTNDAHHVGRGDHAVIIEIAGHHVFHEVFGPDACRPGSQRLFGVVCRARTPPRASPPVPDGSDFMPRTI